MERKKSDIGLIGLAVMGANLSRNIASRGFTISVYNRTKARTEKFLNQFESDNLIGFFDLKEFVSSLSSPRKIGIMVKEGSPVDETINQLLGLIEPGDMIIDFGNSNYHDTMRRSQELAAKGFAFVGCGVSGGEEGALKGPSIMPGGTNESWVKLKPVLEAIAAKDFSGQPTVTHIGLNGAGHYVKMVHNGIEYGIMQMMAEAYDLYRKGYGLRADRIADIFGQYNQGRLQSYLFEISVSVLRQKDDQGEGFLVDKILDQAGQKGTGRWVAIDALERGIALQTITEAVFARTVSSFKAQRSALSKSYSKPKVQALPPIEEAQKMIEDALYAGMLSSYAQGFELMKVASEENSWGLNFAEISRIWEGGCIIRARLLNFLHTAFGKAGDNPPHLLAIPEVKEAMEKSLASWRTVISMFAAAGVSAQSLSTSLAYFETMTDAESPANFLQGLRDYFGAHTYQRTDKDGTFHTEWN